MCKTKVLKTIKKTRLFTSRYVHLRETSTLFWLIHVCRIFMLIFSKYEEQQILG